MKIQAYQGNQSLIVSLGALAPGAPLPILKKAGAHAVACCRSLDEAAELLLLAA